MSRFNFVGPSYTAGSNAVADEECINWYAETIETPGAQTKWSYFGTPGLKIFAALPQSPTRGECFTGERQFTAAGDTLYEVFADGTFIVRMDGTLDEFGGPVSIAFSSIELFIVAGGRGYCYNLAANTFNDVTAQLAGGPVKVRYSDGYFIVMFANSNKFQMSAILDGNTWPGIQVNAVSVFPENIVSIEVSHRELWVFGNQHAQPYQNTGTDEIFDVIPGALIETGAAATFGVDLVDNTVFWISQDIRGGRQAWRASGYTPQRISTHAVETALSSYSADQISNLVSYSYQDGGHLFWVLYIPNTDCTWVFDVAENLWHKRAEWGQPGPPPPPPPPPVLLNATGQAWFLLSRPLAEDNVGLYWSEFSLTGTMPDDAVITGIYPVLVGSAQYDSSTQWITYGISSGIGGAGMNQPYGVSTGAPQASYSDVTFWDNHSLGTSLSALTNANIAMFMASSLFLSNLTDYIEASAVGFAIYYTSDTPYTDPQMPAPFAVPPGQGLAWAVPAAVTDANRPGSGMLTITATSVTSNVATYTYTLDFGPGPGVGQEISVENTTNAGGALNDVNLATTGVGTNTFTCATGAADAATAAEPSAAKALTVPSGGTGVGFAAGTIAHFSDTVPPPTPTNTLQSDGTWGPHRSWNHVYAFGKHLVGDWMTGNLWEMKLPVDNHDGTYDFVTDNGTLIVRERRAPTLNDEMEFVYYPQLVVDFASGLGPQPQLTDGYGNPRPPQAMLQWSNNGGSTWGNQHIANCGFAGEYNTRVIWRRLGRGRKRVFKLTVSDPIPWAITDAYLKTA